MKKLSEDGRPEKAPNRNHEKTKINNMVMAKSNSCVEKHINPNFYT